MNKPRDTFVRKKDEKIKQKRYQRGAGDTLVSVQVKKLQVEGYFTAAASDRYVLRVRCLLMCEIKGI